MADEIRMLRSPTNESVPRVVFTLWGGGCGGAETSTVRLCAAVRSLGLADARIIFLTHSGGLLELAERLEVPTRELHVASGPSLVTDQSLHRELVHFQPHALVLSHYSPLPLLVTQRWLSRAVFVEHGALANLRGMPIRRRMAHLGSRIAYSSHAAGEIAVSDFMRGLQQRVPHAARISTIPHGLDPAEFIYAEPRPHTNGSLVVGAAGRLVSGKGFALAIDAVRILRDSGRSATLLIAGTGPHRSTLIRLADQLGIGGSVELVGRVDDMPRFWASCDVALVPSSTLREAFGMTALEAQACGRPVVASRAGALPEIVDHGTTGYAVQPGASASIAEALVSYVESDTLRVSHGVAARIRFEERFSVSRAAQSYADFLGRVVPGYPSGPVSGGAALTIRGGSVYSVGATPKGMHL